MGKYNNNNNNEFDGILGTSKARTTMESRETIAILILISILPFKYPTLLSGALAERPSVAHNR